MEISLKMGGGTTIVFLFYQNEKSIDINSLFFTVEFKLLVHTTGIMAIFFRTFQFTE